MKYGVLLNRGAYEDLEYRWAIFTVKTNKVFETPVDFANWLKAYLQNTVFEAVTELPDYGRLNYIWKPCCTEAKKDNTIKYCPQCGRDLNPPPHDPKSEIQETFLDVMFYNGDAHYEMMEIINEYIEIWNWDLSSCDKLYSICNFPDFMNGFQIPNDEIFTEG